MKVALVGNPNCGKTYLFNRICRKNMPVGNRPGVTVSAVYGRSGDHEIYDLPGIYSLSDPLNEEKITADFLLSQRPDYIVNVLNPEKLAAGLPLVMETSALGIPTVVVINMRDVAKKRGIEINIPLLTEKLGCPVLFISAKKDKNLAKIFAVGSLAKRNFPADIAEKFSLAEEIAKVCLTASKPARSPDDLPIGKYTAYPIFLAVMTAVLLFSSYLSNLCDRGFSVLENYLRSLTFKVGGSENFRSLVSDGMISGAGGVLKFLPPLFILTYAMNLLEDSGYMSRVAFLSDRLFSSFGCSGRTAVTLLIGCGCTVPAIMSARAIPDGEERERAINWVHLVPCNAKLPLFALLISEIFNNNIFILPLTYLISVFLFFAVNLLKKPKGDSFFLMELPNVRMPDFGGCLKSTFLFLRGFLFRVCTTVFLASIIVWVLINYDFSFRKCGLSDSILMKICDVVKYLFYPVGLTKNYFAAAILSGFAGKETVVGVLEILCSGRVSEFFSLREGIVFYLFIWISSPCAASLTAIKRELGTKKFLAVFFRQILFAYLLTGFVNLLLLPFLK